MKPSFPRIYKAVQFTTEYFEESRIAGCVALLEGDTNFSYLDSYYTATLNFHKQMEDEINQNIYGSNANIQADMFEYLNDWLDKDWRFSPKWDYRVTIDAMINNYNENMWVEYEAGIKIDEEKFKKGVDFSKKHLEVFEREYPATYGLGGFVPKRITKVTNGWFYCNERKPKLIDKELLLEYYKMVDKLISSFRGSCIKYVERYFNGRISSGASILVEKNDSISPGLTTNLLTQPTADPSKKIKVNLSVPQIAYLFKMLHDLKLIESPTKREIQQFISQNFHPNTKGGESGDISVAKLSKIWSDFDISTIKFWTSKFIDLHNETKKGNPNSL